VFRPVLHCRVTSIESGVLRWYGGDRKSLVAIVAKVSSSWCNRRVYQAIVRCREMNESKGRKQGYFSKMKNTHKATQHWSPRVALMFE
jgi:hypothetical protein